MPPGPLSLWVPHTSSPSPKPAFLTLFSSAFWPVPGPPGTKTYDPSPSPPSPISLAKLGDSTMASSGQAKRALRSHTPHCCTCLLSSSWTSELKGLLCPHLLPSQHSWLPFLEAPMGSAVGQLIICCLHSSHTCKCFLGWGCCLMYLCPCVLCTWALSSAQ